MKSRVDRTLLTRYMKDWRMGEEENALEKKQIPKSEYSGNKITDEQFLL